MQLEADERYVLGLDDDHWRPAKFLQQARREALERDGFPDEDRFGNSQHLPAVADNRRVVDRLL